MPDHERIRKNGLTLAFGLLSGLVFAGLMGTLDSADYLVELFSVGIIEVPVIIFIAILTGRYGWRYALMMVTLGLVAVFSLTAEEYSVTGIVFVKVALMGVTLGEQSWFSGSFTRRLTGVAIPGFMLGLIMGVPMLIHEVDPEILERIRQDAISMYSAFMTEDQALNTADNAMSMFAAIFRVAVALHVLSAFAFAWLAFMGARILMPRFGVEAEPVPRISEFTVPFHAIWVFLATFGLLLSGIEQLFPVALNGFIIMAALYLIQGLAVVMHVMNRLELGRLPRILFWVMFFVMIGAIGVVLLVIGVSDNWFRFRTERGVDDDSIQQQHNSYNSEDER
jgi:hypothetical protein